MHILVLDDNEVVLRVIARALLRAGHRVISARSATEALAHAGPFDVAVLDIELPDGCGVDVGAILTAEGRARRVVFCSGTLDPSLRAGARALGVLVDKRADAIVAAL